MSEELSILYVDDDPDIRTIVELALGLDPMIDLRMAGSAGEALSMLARDSWRPQGVLLDVMMPGADGTELMTALRALDGLERVPVIFMTAKTRDADVARYRGLGAAEVIPKPFDPLQLAGRLHAILDSAARGGKSD
jgi:DNA-binding response OmpR family regulator